MSQTIETRLAVLLGLLMSSTIASAQDDLFEGELAQDETPAEETAPEQTEQLESRADEPAQSEPPSPAPAPTPAEAAASADTSASISLDASATSPQVDIDESNQTAPAPEPAPVVTGSHIRRPRLMVEDTLVIDSPLTTETQGRDFLQLRRQLGGVALPDTTGALGHSKFGGPDAQRLQLRALPTLVLLNGRRLVAAPYQLNRGADYVDIGQLPISLVERIEITRGITAGLYGDGAIGGTINVITRRDFEGVEVDIGGQATDKLDQHEVDVTLTVGAGNDTTGMNGMVSYFNRQPLAASDRDWIGQREDRVESLLNNPASYQQISNFNYPFPDPFCDIATAAGHATGLEVRIRGYGPPETLGLLPPEQQEEFLMDHDVARGGQFGTTNGQLDPLETATYCAGDFTKVQDLVIKDERIQTYSTFWHKLSDHTEAFGELGYYRSNNENRTAPAFPIIRLTPDTHDINPVWVPVEHADQPVQQPGFAAVEVPAGRIPNYQFIVGRVAGTQNGSNVNTRRVDVWRGVLGLKGDLEDLARDSVLETWDWEIAGVYSASEAVTTAKDVLMDKLADALNNCEATRIDANRDEVPTTIKERQEAGCFNPFYSSVTNSAAVDPLNVSPVPAASRNGFITTDTDMPGDEGYGVQDGGYVCDPNDPNSPPCPAQFDRDGDGIFELAGTPNTQQVMDRLTGEQITVHRRELATLDGVLRGDLARFGGGGLSFGVGAQARRETLQIDYDAAYNQRLYAFLFGAPDVPDVGRNVVAGFGELRLQVLDGLFEVQPAVRIEHYEGVGTAVNPLAAVAVRPFAASSSPPAALEWLLVRGHVGQGHRAPSLMQLHGTQTEFQSVEFFGSTVFVPHQIAGNPKLDFEKYTTLSGGLQWDFAGIHIGADFWTTMTDDVIASDNSRTLIYDCQAGYEMGFGDCDEAMLLSGTRILDHIETAFDNLAEVDTNGIDGGASYTLDTQRRGLGELGTFVLGVQGTYINSYLIKSPRALREFYRPAGAVPFDAMGQRDYSNVSAEYDAAGYRNLENFAPAMPKLRMAVPLRWLYQGHVIGATMRYVGSYNDDSEHTVERYGLPNINNLALAEGETIPAWTVFDANYGFTFGDEDRRIQLAVGVLNLLDEAPPAVESPLGYEVGVHDPRGRLVYVRATGAF